MVRVMIRGQLIQHAYESPNKDRSTRMCVNREREKKGCGKQNGYMHTKESILKK